jgi:hypothetical protein
MYSGLLFGKTYKYIGMKNIIGRETAAAFKCLFQPVKICSK